MSLTDDYSLLLRWEGPYPKIFVGVERRFLLVESPTSSRVFSGEGGWGGEFYFEGDEISIKYHCNT